MIFPSIPSLLDHSYENPPAIISPIQKGTGVPTASYQLYKTPIKPLSTCHSLFYLSYFIFLHSAYHTMEKEIIYVFVTCVSSLECKFSSERQFCSIKYF